MTCKIHILTAGFTSPNGAAFLFPLISHRTALKQAGFNIGIFNKVSPSLTDCDVLILDSKYYSKGWMHHTDHILAEITGYKAAGVKIIYADISDSTGWVHLRMADVVDLYLKSQLLKERSNYLKPLYGYRYFCDYYHEHMGVEDKANEFSQAAPNEEFLDKLTLGWNSGLADYSILGPYKAMAYHKIPFPPLLRYPKALSASVLKENKSFSCRFGTSYDRPTVAHQRVEISRLLKARIGTVQKLKRKEYFAEMGRAQLVMSPFGLGEITLKDFECFLVGSALLKPRMDHMETWPNFFVEDETMFAFDWDLKNLEERLDQILATPDKCFEVAEKGQEVYLSHTSGNTAADKFVSHFSAIIEKLSETRKT